MNRALSLKPTQPGRALVLLGALGFTALVGFAALEPATEPGNRVLPAAQTDGQQAREFDPALRAVEPGVFAGTSAPHFERSNEPELATDPANPHGG